ncbi:EAL domain-containing protein [Acidaminobacter sp. JC074]|uniref:EAL domain-containing protein n=1 Tax=Acidaminobacter sp. JC074 TaxID=2530199 RepID=UPI001F113F52|nr:EAL domain-containing protein [Acidaminobacter sp. JC074]MCH4889265.1 EAL domain-containing protein [Acidaminobacter sp. JC074]
MDYKLQNLVDIERLQQLLDNLYDASGIPSGIIGADGEVITATGWRDICTKFHRVNDITNKRCIESDTSIQIDIKSGKKYVVSECKNGMVDIASPIIIDDKHIATIFQGQFFFEKPNLDFYRALASEVGFDETSYLSAIEVTPIITEEEIKPVVEFLTDLASFIADLGYSRLKVEKQHLELQTQHEELGAVYEELVATEEELRGNYKLINERNDSLETLNNDLKFANAGYELISEGSYDATWDVDLLSKEPYFSSNIVHIIERDTVPEVSDIMKNIIHQEDLDSVKNNFFSALADAPNYDDRFRIHTPSGVKWLHVKGKIQRKDGKAIRVAGSIGDITEKLENEMTIKQMAYTDNLTGISNRNQMYLDLHDHLKRKKEHPQESLAIVFLDLDNFKNINDIYGHSTGDDILQQVANRLKQHCSTDTTVYRFGGDEFIFVSSYPNGAIISLTEEILRDFELPYIHNDQSFSLTGSIGIATYPIDGMTADILIKNADTAMYEAKNRGRNQYAKFDIAMHESLVEKKHLDESMEAALHAKEFELMYQPIVDTQTSEIDGLEALIRWKRGYEYISPAKFIPQAEANGFIRQIDYFVLETAIKQLVAWREKGYDFTYISVNVSPNFLMEENLMTKLEGLIRKYPFSPSDIQIEITENIIIESFDLAYSVLSTLKMLGFTIAMDDFGTGYSSLNYLKSLPIDVLKIDKYFVDGLEHKDPIIEFIIGMGQRLKLKVVAEGVESDKQLELLKKYKCDKYQGYFHSKPMLASQIEKMMEIE